MSEFNPVILSLPSSFTPSLALEILPYGLTIHRLFVRDSCTRTHDLVIGPEVPHDHVGQKYTNSIVGRYANRVPVATHALERHGIKSNFNPLPNENDLVSLHGGPIGFDAVPWTLLSEDDPPRLFSATELSHLAPSTASSHAFFRLISPSGDQGFPGKLVTEAFIALIGPITPQHSVAPAEEENSIGSVVLVYRAKLDEGGKKVVTPVNLTQHWGFNLDASLQDGPDYLSIQNYMLTIKADRIAELGPHALATGKFIPVSTLPSHNHNPKRIGDKFPPGGYDDYYAFTHITKIPTRIPLADFTPKLDLLIDLLRPSSSSSSNDVGGGYRAEPVVEVSSAKSGFKLVFDTNQYGVMFYSNNMADPSKGARKKIHGGSGISGNGDAYGPSHAAFFEFHQPLSAFLFDNNKDAEDTLLTSDELYHNYVRCDVKLK